MGSINRLCTFALACSAACIPYLEYGEAEFKVTASIGLVEGMRFVNDMLLNGRSQVA